MMNKHAIALCVVSALLPSLTAQCAEITVNPAKVTGKVSPLLYGQFLEHIYRSVVGGLWSEMVMDRSFEAMPLGKITDDIEVVHGSWTAANGVLTNDTTDTPGYVVFGDAKWKDYDYTYEFKKLNGSEGMLIPFRYTDTKNLYWWNIGGWGNTRSAVERTTDGNKMVVKEYPSVGAAIQSGKWYRVKISCRGDVFSFYLDDVLAGSYTDDTHPTGKVGLGIYATSVMVRNIKVAAPDGRVLLAPKLTATRTNGLAKDWSVTKSSNNLYVGLSSTALNGKHSCEYDARGLAKTSTAAVSQQVAVQQGRKYVGSIWAKALPGARLQVSLQTSAGCTVQNLPIPSAKWTQYPISLTAKGTTGSAKLSIKMTGNTQCWVDQFSVMPAEAAKGVPIRADLLERVKALRPTFIRWPGGCFAEYYRWKDGIGAQHKRVTAPNYMWGGLDPNGFGTDEYIQLCRSVGAEPYICLNIGQHEPSNGQSVYLQEALDWIEYCNGAVTTKYGKIRAANGHPQPYNVKYWEIGNETWPMTPERYAQYVNTFRRAIQAKYPNIHLLVCGSASMDVDWNKKLAASVDEPLGLLSCHTYWGGTWMQQMAYADDYVATLQRSLQQIRNDGHPKAQLAITEWNNGQTDMAGAISGASMLINSESAGEQVALACPAVWLRNTDAPAWNNALINFDNQNNFISPLYWVCQSFRKAYAPELVECSYTCGGFDINGRSYGNLSAVATKDSSARRIVLKVANRSEKSDETATVQGLNDISQLSVTTIASDSADSQNSIQNPKNVVPVYHQMKISQGKFKYKFPKRSVTLFEGMYTK